MIKIKESELHFSFVRSSGPGGQHVNKVSTAVQLKYNIYESDISDDMKQRFCLLYTSPSPRDATLSRMPSSA